MIKPLLCLLSLSVLLPTIPSFSMPESSEEIDDHVTPVHRVYHDENEHDEKSNSGGASTLETSAHTRWEPVNKVDLLHVENTESERAHVQEHLKEVDTSKMTESELQFYHFRLMDYDKNDKLDGNELIKSILHYDHDDEHKAREGETHPQFSDEDLMAAIDPAISEGDMNFDGYIDYTEYSLIKSKRQKQFRP